jgi:hypothetical protein
MVLELIEYLRHVQMSESPSPHRAHFSGGEGKGTIVKRKTLFRLLSNNGMAIYVKNNS